MHVQQASEDLVKCVPVKVGGAAIGKQSG
jgi:hypothetical protein